MGARIRSRRWPALVAALCALASLAVAQSAPEVTAQLSAGVARLGEEIALQVVVEGGGQARLLPLPAVQGLELGVPAGPSSERGMRIQGGRREQWNRTYWRIPVRARAEGDFEIPSLDVEVDGQRLATRKLSLRVVRDLTGEDLGFLELTPTPARVVEGQPFSLEIRFGWDADTRVDLANLHLPWWGELSGVVELDQRELPASAKRIEGVGVNGGPGPVAEQVESRRADGREMLTFRLVKSFVPGRPGTIEFPTSFLEFGQRLPARSLFESSRKKTFFVQAPPLALEVVPLPSEGQPFDFSGAVGTLAARASADTRDVVVGDSIKLQVVWTGSGNLEFFDAPDLAHLDAFEGFRVYGRTEEKGFDRRAVTYDLAPMDAAVERIPAVPLSVFDPEAGRYGVVATEPIPIRVRALEGRTSLTEEEAPRFERDVRDIDVRPLAAGAERHGPAPTDGLLVALCFALPAAWLLARGAVRRRRGDPDAPRERRRRRARRTLVRELRGARSAQERLGALTRFLAARAGDPDEAWVGRDPARWLAGRGAAHEATEAAPVRAVLARLEAEVWGSGGGAPVSAEEILAAAERWQRATGAGRAA